MRVTVTEIMTAAVLAGFITFGAMADGPTVSDVVVRQRWPWNRLVDISYSLDCVDGQHADVQIKAFDGETELTLEADSLSGDQYGVSRGFRRIVWDPTQSAYTNQALMRFNVELSATNSPLYMIVDLTKAAGDAGQLEYVYPDDARLETYGRFTNVWLSVTNDPAYATDKLVLRRVSAGSDGMGSSASVPVSLTEDFYVGVFEMTQRQWELIMGSNPSYFNNQDYYATRPVEQVAYNTIRGATNSTPAIDWPSTGRAVLPTSFLGQLREKTGIETFDLPTESQWEYACRAGTATIFNDGDTAANISGVNQYTNTWLNALGRYKFDGGYLEDGFTQPARTCAPSNGTALVGSYLPNAWGLYDMHGNVNEACLDWAGGTPTGGTDPVGAASGSFRVNRSGGAWEPAGACYSGARNVGLAPSSPNGRFGFRVVRFLP